MKRKLLALLITLAMLGGTYSTIPAIISHMNRGMQKASHGELDLSKWRFEEDGAAKLDGEWEFYPNLLLGAQDFARGSIPSPQMIAVPGSWSSKMDTLGKATYRLRVHISDGEHVYGLKTLNIQMSGRIIVNGQVIGSSGSPAEKQSYVGMNKPIVSYFTMRPGLNEVIVQVANYHSPSSSGIFNSIFLGYQQQISELQSKALSHDWVTFTSYLIMGLYFIGLYTQRRRDQAQPSVATVVHLNLMQGYEDGTIRPASLITRAEVATLLRNVLLQSNLIQP